MRTLATSFALLVAALVWCSPDLRADPITVDKDKKTILIPCTVAPRKLPHLDKTYPIEVIATNAYRQPKGSDVRGQKAHETVVVIDDKIKPSDVHKALEQFGLKPGKPAIGEGTKAEGPEVRVFLEVPGADGNPQKLPIEKTLTDTKTGKPVPALKWHFTGSAMKQPDPEKDDKVYGADFTGTFIGLFPVTNDTVFQTNLTMKEEPLLKLETNKSVLPKEGTPVKLIIEVK
jgi:hypothetical protein